MLSFDKISAKHRKEKTECCFGLLLKEPNKMVILQDPGNISESLYTISRKYTKLDVAKHSFNNEKLSEKIAHVFLVLISVSII